MTGKAGVLRVAAFLALTVFAGLCLTAGQAAARDQISIVGSSTVYPFATTVAEQFGDRDKFKAPVVESTGTGGGLKLFCAGTGDGTPDIANASRSIKDSEKQICQQNGVTDILEVPIGYDGIALVNGKAHKRLSLSVRDVWLALARQVPVGGKLVDNPYKTWADVNPALPADRIAVLGPPPTSGTRDAFVELVMDRACKTFPEITAIADEKARQAACGALREDGAYIEAGENDNLVVQKLEADPTMLGILGYSFLIQNQDKLQGSEIDGVAPVEDDILSGRYEIARRLFLYVKMQHIDSIPGLPEYVAEFVSDRASGGSGYLTDKGLIPLAEAEHEAVALATLKALGYENGTRQSSDQTFLLPPNVMPVALTVALLGLTGLAGILMRNTLILTQQVADNSAAGMPVFASVVEAAVQRARPVVLTALAAVFAFVPLTQDGFWGPLAYVLIGGVAVGTAITLLFVPALYALWFRLAPAASAEGSLPSSGM